MELHVVIYYDDQGNAILQPAASREDADRILSFVKERIPDMSAEPTICVLETRGMTYERFVTLWETP